MIDHHNNEVDYADSELLMLYSATFLIRFTKKRERVEQLPTANFCPCSSQRFDAVSFCSFDKPTQIVLIFPCEKRNHFVIVHFEKEHGWPAQSLGRNGDVAELFLLQITQPLP